MGLFQDTYISNYITKNYNYFGIGVIDFNKKTNIAIITCPECQSKGETDQGYSSSDGWSKHMMVCLLCDGKRVVKFKVPMEVLLWKPKKLQK